MGEPKQTKREECFECLVLFGLVDYDAERLLKWIEAGDVPGIVAEWK